MMSTGSNWPFCLHWIFQTFQNKRSQSSELEASKCKKEGLQLYLIMLVCDLGGGGWGNLKSAPLSFFMDEFGEFALYVTGIGVVLMSLGGANKACG